MVNNNNIKVSVIIPIYKTEKYIEKCARSLFEQTLSNIEYIFVDDCGNDSSIEILNNIINEYPERNETIRIIHHEKNRGLPAARETGIKCSKGEYIIHCDSDDWVETDMYETLYNAAKEEEADVVWCNFIDEFSNNSDYRIEDGNCNPEELIKNILISKRHGAVWNKLVRKEIYTKNNIHPLAGVNIWEDLYMSVIILLHSTKISYVNKALYHYNLQNTSSLLHGITEKKMQDKIMVCNQLELVFKERGLSQKYDKALKHRKLWAKMEYATDREIRNFDKWRSLWPEAVKETGSSNFSVFNKILFKLLAGKHDTTAKIMLAIKDRLKKNI